MGGGGEGDVTILMLFDFFLGSFFFDFFTKALTNDCSVSESEESSVEVSMTLILICRADYTLTWLQHEL